MVKTIHSSEQIALVAALVEARKRAGMTQGDVAVRLGCHQSLVARIESGQRRIDVRELIILCRALEADSAEILRQVELATPRNARI